MAKIAKRVKKFQASGGIKGKLSKGSVTKKGKLKRRSEKEKDATSKPKVVEEQVEEGVSTASEIGDMDMEAFMKSVGDDENSESEEEEEEEEVMEDTSDADDAEDASDVDSMGESDSDSENSDADMDEAKMMEKMAEMAEADPEFMAHLKKNEPGLLEFGQGDDDDEDDAEDDQEEQEPVKKRKAATTEPDPQAQKELTADLLNTLTTNSFKKHSLQSLKKLLSAYSSAARMTDVTADDTNAKGAYTIPNDQVYAKLIELTIKHSSKEFKRCLPQEAPTDDNEPYGNPSLFSKSEHWKAVKPMLLSFFKSTLHLLTAIKSKTMIKQVLTGLTAYIPLILPFEKQQKSLLKRLVNIWSSPLDDSQDNVLRFHAFLNIRQMSTCLPSNILADILKSTYLNYAKLSKYMTETSLPTLYFLGNSLVELYSLSATASYQHAFIYIRMLSLHLRAAITKQTKVAVQAVHNWQFFNCLRVWTAIIATKPDKQDLGDLVYPLVEIILGLAKLVPSTRHLPLRLHCVRLLQQLAGAANLFIPTSAILLDMLSDKGFSKKSRGSAPAPKLPLLLALPKEDPVGSSVAQDVLIGEIFLLLNREIDLYRYTIAFPEFSLRITTRLKTFAKESFNQKWAAYCHGAVELCGKFTASAKLARGKFDGAPKDVKLLECLKPVGASSMGDRLEASVGKEKRFEEWSGAEGSEVAVGEKQKKKEQRERDNIKKKEAEEREAEEREAARREKKRKGDKEKKQRYVEEEDVDIDEMEDEVEELAWSDMEGDSDGDE